MATIAPAPSGSRGEVILQPAYFTSSIFVKALRDDITTLILTYHEQYTNAQPAQPFLLFKSLWTTLGWKWLHFMVFDDRTRETFLNVVLRLFLERMVKTEAPYSRAVALFGFYTFFYTQPVGTAPPLHSISHVPIPLDHYASLKALPTLLNASHLLSLQPAVFQILSTLFKDDVFFIVPSSELGPLNPRDLPREIFLDEVTILPVDLTAPKKKGRPTKRDKAKKAKTALEELEKWLDQTAGTTPQDSSSPWTFPAEDTHETVTQATLEHYQAQKSHLLDSIDSHQQRMDIEKANEFVLERLKATEELVSVNGTLSTGANDVAGVARVERAAIEFTNAEGSHGGGVLSLLEGAGRSQV
ncbi:hypothetical protein Hypma_015696 [Hypsizygus marmoreus]|uniref:Uncharacterized protein n=1 Tax=Hypsizygus marmoreus TaxID=39966 RepID=A0A369KD23_HYPMA|nr:hypothetical protein Hypma_015696 [Hypsizygus marmoreus]